MSAVSSSLIPHSESSSVLRLREEQTAIDCAVGCSVCLDCGSNSQLDPTFECPEWCAPADLTLVPEGMLPCNSPCIAFIGCFNCAADTTA